MIHVEAHSGRHSDPPHMNTGGIMPKTILLADDSVTIQKVVGISFASEDIEVIAVDNGDDAIARAREMRPDVVLADVVMPGKNGYEVCEALKSDPALAAIPVLLLSGTFEAFDEERAQRAGAAGHIAKPFEAQALVDQVRRLFDARSAPPVEIPEVPPPAPAVPLDVGRSDAFAFIDDDLGDAELAPPRRGSGSESLDQDSVFEFDDAEMVVEESAQSFSTPPTPGISGSRSVSVATDPWPESEAVEVTDAEPMPEQLDTVLETDFWSAARTDLDELSIDEAAPLDPGTTADDEPFDFSFESRPASRLAAPTAEDADPMLPVDANDLAEATVLDPKGASGYDVSFSDLGPSPRAEEASMVGEAHAGPPGAEETVLAPEFQSGYEPAGRVRLEPDSNDLAGPGPDALDVEPEPLQTAGLADTAPVPPVPAPAADPALTVLAPEFQPDPSPSHSATSASPAGPPPASEILKKIEPQLRQQLHDTLEKIAWESFGDLTEAIVKQSVQRVEEIAWEVIPELAETLIRDEIRRLKGEPPAED